jgi:crotonobetainyl-CoA:carnitine CoA-transferase CaiB-like acyl-CoA transferase
MSKDVAPAGGSLPLAGLTMVELGSSVAAPFGAQVFADLGATVLKVESKKGDDARHWGPPFWHGAGAAFQTLKPQQTLGGDRPEGRS